MAQRKERGSIKKHPAKQRFTFSSFGKRKATKIARDEASDDVRALQGILTQMGYLGRDRQPGVMCGRTCDALRHFQKCYGLSDTGEADDKTLELMQRPRCGVPDISPGVTSSGAAPFVLRGCNYDTNNLSYAFINSTPDLAQGRQQEIIRAAFSAWSDVTPLTFSEVAPGNNPDFPIAFERLDHGDGSPFDDAGSVQGNTLAHAFYPPPCGGAFSGALHFDEFEFWVDQATPNGIRLLNVAIHEIGHLLGLDHSNNQNAIMFAFYDDAADSLRQDDIDGVQELYGPRVAGTAPIRGSLTGNGDSNLHRIPTQAGLMIARLVGPPGQDFDLYLRAGLPPTRVRFDARGFTSTSIEEIRIQVTGGDVFALVDSWRGAGLYELFVAFE